MVGKVIVHAATRAECIARVKTALAHTVIEGVTTNISLHERILVKSAFYQELQYARLSMS